MRFVATFHTHLSAMLTCRTLTAAGIEARMAPTPRAVSSSCGTCVLYAAAEPCLPSLDEDTEAVYEQTDGGYRLIQSFG